MTDLNYGAPRTLIVDLSLRFGGASARALGLLQGMPEGCAAYAGMDGSPVTERAKALGLEVYTVGSQKADPRIAGRLGKIIRKGGFQVLDTQNVQSKVWGSIAAARAGVAVVSTLNSWYMNEHVGGARGPIYHAMERATSLLTDLYIAVSPEIHDCLRASGVSNELIMLIPNAVEIDVSSIAGGPSWLRRSYDLPEDARVICAVGRLVEAKGYHHLVNSMARIAEEHPSLYCLIVGEGHLRPELEAQILRSGLQERIRLLGFRQPDEVFSIVKSSDLFVMPSLTEGTPVALLEAAALAKPVLASHVGGIPSIIEHGKNGWLVDPGDEEALAEGLVALCSRPDDATRLGEAAQARVQSDFGLRAQVSATQAAYQKALAHQTQRSF